LLAVLLCLGEPVRLLDRRREPLVAEHACRIDEYARLEGQIEVLGLPVDAGVLVDRVQSADDVRRTRSIERAQCLPIDDALVFRTPELAVRDRALLLAAQLCAVRHAYAPCLSRGNAASLWSSVTGCRGRRTGARDSAAGGGVQGGNDRAAGWLERCCFAWSHGRGLEAGVARRGRAVSA